MQSRRSVLAATATVTALWSLPAAAQQRRSAATYDLPQTFLDNLKSTGVTHEIRQGGQRPTLVVVIDQSDFIEAIPTLQRMKVLNDELGTTYINQHQFSMMVFYANFISPLILRVLYERHESLGALGVEALVVYGDEFGQERRETLLTYEFTRDLHRKINWDRFETRNLSRVAPRYRLTPFATRKVQEEM